VEDSTDTNAAIWKSDDAVQAWLRDVDKRERTRLPEWQLMGQLLPFAETDRFTFVDLGAGTGAAARVVLDLFPNARVILADFSPQMMAQAAVTMREYGDRWSYVEFDMLAGTWPHAIPDAVDAVITSQCVHHLPDSRKQSLFTEIFGRLVPGGWYLNFDPVTADDVAVEAVWERANDRLDPAAAQKRLNRTPEEEARHANHVRYMIPLGPQLGFLRAAGFEAVDVYWKRLDYVIYGGRRPLAS
jgi:tRNA (cmo5U34)-methyltransferase